jgi:hypothetical protein
MADQLRVLYAYDVLCVYNLPMLGQTTATHPTPAGASLSLIMASSRMSSAHARTLHAHTR